MLAALRRAPARQRGGLTMVELLVGLAIVAVLAALATPSLNEFIMRKRVDSITNEVMADIRMARNTTLQLNRLVAVTFESSGTTSCYTVSTNINLSGGCDCRNGAGNTCVAIVGTPATELKTANILKSTGVVVTPSDESLFLNGLDGMTGGKTFTVDVTSSVGGSLRVLVSGTALSSICSVSGHPAYPTCP